MVDMETIFSYTEIAVSIDRQFRKDWHIMAVVTVVSFGIRDADGNLKSMPLYVDGASTVANIQLYVNDFAPLLDATNDGKIESAQATIGLTLPGGLKASPVANSNDQEGALISFDVTATNYNYGLFIPAWSVDYFDGKTVKLTETAVGDLMTQLITGTHSVKALNNAGLALVSVIDGKKRFRK